MDQAALDIENHAKYAGQLDLSNEWSALGHPQIR
jgi:hypothetical protein